MVGKIFLKETLSTSSVWADEICGLPFFVRMNVWCRYSRSVFEIIPQHYH